jgi:hypothetical protein
MQSRTAVEQVPYNEYVHENKYPATPFSMSQCHTTRFMSPRPSPDFHTMRSRFTPSPTPHNATFTLNDCTEYFVGPPVNASLPC